mmetsp:Transcript_98709/g.156027  ORF Transcript_98709/g.156027 Transcript_98709/m.156027 type:complete len:419 (-) Transcript_98709:119-1375(-)
MVESSSQARRGRGRGRGRGKKADSNQNVKDEQGSLDLPEDMEKHVSSCEQLEVDTTNGDENHDPPDDSERGLNKWEQRLWSEGFPVVAGTDEAGRGPLAGPVVAAAFAILAHDDQEVQDMLLKINDSKQMTSADRDLAYEQLVDERFKGRTVWAVAEASASRIDDSNILSAALAAMSESVQGLAVRPDCVLVDGCNRPPELLKPGETWTRGTKEERRRTEELKQIPKLSKWFAPKKDATPKASEVDDVWRPRRVEAVIHGDALVPSISAASIIAKVHRDRLMSKIHEKYPVYGFASHQGYGTAEHMEALKLHGPCPEHRRSVRPVREVLGLDLVEEVAPGQQTLTTLLGGKAAPKRESTTALEKIGVEDATAQVSMKQQTDEETPEKCVKRRRGATPKSVDGKKRKVQPISQEKTSVV